MRISLYPYQREAVDAIQAAYRGGMRRPALSAATGSGKTLMFSKLIEESGERSLVIAHRKEIIEQAAQKIGYVMPPSDIGIVMGDRNQFDTPVVVASIQTIANPQRLARLGRFGLVVVDEAHHAASPSYVEVLRRLGVSQRGGTKALGVSATWDRADNLGFEEVFEDIVYSVDIETLIASGHLVDIRALLIETHLDTAGVPSSRGDFNAEALSRRIVDSDYADTLAAAVKEHASDRHSLVFAPNVRTAALYRDALRQVGIAAEMVDANTPRSEREEIVAALGSGRLQAVVNCGVFTEGTDIPIVDCLDEETEILTAQGWKGIDDEFGEVTALDPDSGQLEDVPVQARVTKEWGGESVRLQSGQYDLHVTPNHRMLIGTGRRDRSMEFRPASDLPSLERFRMPISGNPVASSGVPLSDDDLRFIAWFTTDGSWHRARNQIVIAQSKPTEVERIRALLDRLELRWSEHTGDNSRGLGGENALPLTRFIVPVGVRGHTKGRGFERLLPYLDKDLAPSLLGMNAQQFRVFWEELLHGDGNNDPRPTVADQLCVSSDVLLSRLQAVAVRCGFATNASHRVLPSGRSMWWLGVSERRFLEIKPNDKRRESPSVWIAPQERPRRFWCVQNAHSTLIVRRRGSVAIVGNCIVMGRPTKSRALYQQMAGRALRRYPGKDNALILDLVGNAERLDLQSAASLIGRQRKPGQTQIRSFRELIAEPAETETKGALGTTFVQQAKAVELIDRKRLAWTQVDLSAAGVPVFSLPVGEAGQIILQDDSQGAFNVVRYGRDRTRETLAEHMDIGYAQGIAEAYVAEAGVTTLVNPKARWRTQPASDKQKEALAKWRIPFEPGITKGDASDLLDQAMTRANLRRRDWRDHNAQAS